MNNISRLFDDFPRDILTSPVMLSHGNKKEKRQSKTEKEKIRAKKEGGKNESYQLAIPEGGVWATELVWSKYH